jgi:phosphoribosylanthranilate isomerase
MNRTRIKICGITNVPDAIYAASLGCDALGFNFYEKSPRVISVEKAKTICKQLPALVNKVALFVNPDDALVNQVISSVQIDTLQFHGNEHPYFCEQFKKPYIKALSLKENETEASFLKRINGYTSASSILLDSYDPINIGGSGNVFDWNKIPEEIRSKIILAGGLTSKNVSQAINHIQPFAVDISSGVEKEDENSALLKGQKSHEKMLNFVNVVNKANQKK